MWPDKFRSFTKKLRSFIIIRFRIIFLRWKLEVLSDHLFEMTVWNGWYFFEFSPEIWFFFRCCGRSSSISCTICLWPRNEWPWSRICANNWRRQVIANRRPSALATKKLNNFGSKWRNCPKLGKKWETYSYSIGNDRSFLLFEGDISFIVHHVFGHPQHRGQSSTIPLQCSRMNATLPTGISTASNFWRRSESIQSAIFFPNVELFVHFSRWKPPNTCTLSTGTLTTYWPGSPKKICRRRATISATIWRAWWLSTVNTTYSR